MLPVRPGLRIWTNFSMEICLLKKGRRSRNEAAPSSSEVSSCRCMGTGRHGQVCKIMGGTSLGELLGHLGGTIKGS